MQVFTNRNEHLPKAKAILDDNGIALDMERHAGVRGVKKVMNEAYELGKADKE
ncbi:competence protein ComG [Bacillus sp. UFRGS-B20]|nr:competence protein ComG [Bacillus sp. UFRGS-B20]